MSANERFSGHESFVCRYGWLPKAYRAVVQDAFLLREEERAMHELGIGRNMVKSLQFWCEATGVLVSVPGEGHAPGPVGLKLLDADSGWDPHLESLDSLWLLHWRLCTQASLAAWAEVFGEARLVRFDRQRLVAALARRAEGASRPLAATTLEQHAFIFLQTYYQEERGGDDTSWCPLQDLELLRVSDADGRTVFSADLRAPVGLSLRVFAIALTAFIGIRKDGVAQAVEFSRLLKAPRSPGTVFRMDEQQLRLYVEKLAELDGSLRFVDTADTQSVVVDPRMVNSEYLLNEPDGVLAHA
jgi:hypothetical protein